MTIKQVISGQDLRVPVKIWTNDIEAQALEQSRKLAQLPFIYKNGVALMPDVHAGIGSTVGSVIATKGAVIPAAVGVDIGCGMNAVRTSLRAEDLPDSLRTIRLQIERDVPLGAGGAHKTPKDIPQGLDLVLAKHPDIARRGETKAASQMGTLGSGNHFIELCLDEVGSVWIMLHSGSRGIGNMIGRYFIERAKRLMEQWFITLPDSDLAYLPDGSQDFTDYVEAITWAQDYARFNRDTMMNLVIATMLRKFPQLKIVGEVVNCHHNFTSLEEHFGEKMWVTRKGAVSAKQDQMGIIPGSMGAKSFIVKGKGNSDAYCSCSHGAGRKYSRAGAKRIFSVLDLETQTLGVECRKDQGVLDEIPGAYKDIDEVMAAQSDLVEVVSTLKQVMCIKG